MPLVVRPEAFLIESPYDCNAPAHPKIDRLAAR